MISFALDRAATRRAMGGLAMAGLLALGVAAMSPLASLAQDEEQVVVGTASGDLGTYLVGPDGRTLYFFAKDVTPAVSACSGDCLTNWPPLLVEEGYTLVAGDGVTGPLATATQADGSVQATYDGRPLYTFAGDTEAGQTNGQGKGDVWFVASVDGSIPASTAAPSSSAAPAGAALTLGTATSDLGTFLTGKNGLTLYYFASDSAPGASTCEGDCLTAWPPAGVPANGSVAPGDGVTGVVGLIPAADGSMQATYDGRPLYYFAGDTAAGQTNGQGIGGVWSVADVSGNLPAVQQ